jgi:hypothetical protein
MGRHSEIPRIRVGFPDSEADEMEKHLRGLGDIE